jgi:hypothetical protein
MAYVIMSCDFLETRKRSEMKYVIDNKMEVM